MGIVALERDDEAANPVATIHSCQHRNRAFETICDDLRIEGELFCQPFPDSQKQVLAERNQL